MRFLEFFIDESVFVFLGSCVISFELPSSIEALHVKAVDYPGFPMCLSDWLPSLIQTPNNPTVRLLFRWKLSLPPNEFLPLVIFDSYNNLLLNIKKKLNHFFCSF